MNKSGRKYRPDDLDGRRKKACLLCFSAVGRENERKLRSEQMKSILLSFILLLGISSLLTTCTRQDDRTSDEATLNNVDAVQAMAIANQWKWSKEEIKSYVTPHEVVFEFSNGNVKKIPLPEEKVVVAVAPYIERTHR